LAAGLLPKLVVCLNNVLFTQKKFGNLKWYLTINTIPFALKIAQCKTVDTAAPGDTLNVTLYEIIVG